MADRIVVDASVALKWQFRDELETEQAIQMLVDFINGKIELISPSLFAYEIVNAVNIAVIKERMSEKEGLDAINDILSIGVVFLTLPALLKGHLGLQGFIRGQFMTVHIYHLQRKKAV